MQQMQILPVKARILEASIEQSQEALNRVLQSFDIASIKKHIRELNAQEMDAPITISATVH